MNKIVITILFSFLISPLCFATGGVDAGGGGAFVCRNADGSVRDSELLDLWEANVVRKWPISRSNESVDAQIEKALTRLASIDPTFATYISAEVREIQASYEVLPSNIAVAPPTDALNGYMKPGCPLEGMMYFDGDLNRMRLSGNIFDNLLSNTDKAASFLHEAIYKHYRDSFMDSDSRHSRKLVGCLFSSAECMKKNSFQAALENARGMEINHCQSSEIDYYTWKYQDEKTKKVRFHYLFSRIFERQFSEELFLDTPASAGGYGFGTMSALQPFGYQPYGFTPASNPGEMPTPLIGTVAVYEMKPAGWNEDKYIRLSQPLSCTKIAAFE